MLLELADSQAFDEMNYSREPLGPSSRGCCQCVFGNSCGSGSLVGKRNGKSLVLTNAHVAGTRVGTVGRIRFPHWDNQVKAGRVIMAAYSDRVMMDWAIVEMDMEVPLPHTKLSLSAPTGEHYTGGYPRCQGPFYQRLVTRDFLNSGTVWRWSPNSIGGQSGSGVHSFSDNLQRGLLTWSWAGLGAGQTTRSIYLQYSQRGEIGFARPEGLIELGEPNPEVASGFFAETNITTLPIWAEIGGDDDGGNTDPDNPDLKEFAAVLLERLTRTNAEIADLLAFIRPFANGQSQDGGKAPEDPPSGGGGPTFGL